MARGAAGSEMLVQQRQRFADACSAAGDQYGIACLLHDCLADFTTAKGVAPKRIPVSDRLRSGIQV